MIITMCFVNCIYIQSDQSSVKTNETNVTVHSFG